MIPQIYLRRGKEESLLRRHPWIFSGAIDYIKAEEESEIAEGALVEVFDHKGAFIARGHYQIGSIAVRHLLWSTLLAVWGASSLWGIGELFEQRKRVEKGWFPRNPKRKS